MIFPSTLIRFSPTLGGYRPFQWRLKNGKWNDMSTLKGRCFPLFQFVMDELEEARLISGGTITEQFMKDQKFQKKNGFYVVEYMNCL